MDVGSCVQMYLKKMGEGMCVGMCENVCGNVCGEVCEDVWRCV